MTPTKLEKLKKLLIKSELISKEDIAIAESEAARSDKELENILVEKNLIKSEQLGELIADINNWKFVSLKQEGVDVDVLRMVPMAMARKQHLIGFAKTANGIKLATCDPDNPIAAHLLQKKLGQKIISYYAIKNDLKEQLSSYKSDIHKEFEKIIKEQAKKATVKGEEENATVLIVNMLLERGYESNASDVHIEPFETETMVRFRIDGLLQEIIKIPKEAHSMLISRIKVMSHMRIDEHQAPQDGKLRYSFADQKMDVRVSIIPTTNGENAVMRLLSEKSSELSLDDLGYNEKDLAKLKKSIKKPWGMILATGPTGSGKTTTLYAILKILNKRTVNVTTIEDPVEYSISGITQIQVNPKANLTFASGLRSIVRQDPDIIMIGEIRDNETAEIAINSAMTGHLVLSTLHTNDAPTALPRLSDMKIEPFLVASTINIIIAQRLVRKICASCIVSYETSIRELSRKVPEDVLEKFSRNNERIVSPDDKITLFKGAGCPACNNSGFAGRTGVYEILEVDDDIRELIIKNTSAEEIMKKAVANGMTTMFDDARENVFNGVTTLEEMLRVVKK
ncbi:GspE/PulE family protein [Patescibacteria group bacterium]|nr:GspE/PulE family protein [Patescibacteria group bacterium]MBU1703139.1 GspE/PulE family protein [Patescibacteria group bacterium]MBU1954141.1 GspE/PulE family protein [Patescibacteria group bacterium]